MISGTSGMSYEERLSACELVPLENRREYHDLVQMYRFLYKIDTIDHNIVEFKNTEKCTRSKAKANAVEKRANTDLRKNFFTCRASNAWNKLPQEIQKTLNFEEFKSKLRNYLFC